MCAVQSNVNVKWLTTNSQQLPTTSSGTKHVHIGPTQNEAVFMPEIPEDKRPYTGPYISRSSSQAQTGINSRSTQ